MKLKTIGILLISIILVIFTLQNSQVVEVKMLHWHFEISRVLLILISVVLGLIAGLLVSLKKKK